MQSVIISYLADRLTCTSPDVRRNDVFRNDYGERADGYGEPSCGNWAASQLVQACCVAAAVVAA